MNFPLHLLKTLVTFAKTQKMGQTALALQMSQPAISLQFKQMQTYLPHPVVMRQGQRWILTEYGKEIVKTIAPILTHMEEEWRRIHLYYGDPQNREIRIACRKELFGHLMSLSAFPGKIIFYDLKSEEATEKLLKNEIDLAITHHLPHVHYIKGKYLFSQNTRLIVHKKWLKKYATDEYQELISNHDFILHTPWIVYNKNAEFIRLWLKKNKLTEDQLFIKSEVADWPTISALVSSGQGFALVPTGVALTGDMLEIEIPERIIPPRKFYLLYSETMANLPLVKSFL